MYKTLFIGKNMYKLYIFTGKEVFILKNKRYLNIKGTNLDNEQLINYMEKLAIDYDITNLCSKETFPIPRLNDNFKFIQKTYNILNEHIKKKIGIYPAGEWLLDNFYIIEETVKNIRNELTEKKYKNFQAIYSGPYKGFARIYLLATEIVAFTENKIDEDVLELCLTAYEKKKTLSMEEIWNLPIFLNIAIIENIRAVCEKIYLSQTQKYKVEEIVERIIDKTEYSKQQYKKSKESTNSYSNTSYPFIEYMSYKLKRYGKNGIPYLNILEEQVNRTGLTVSDVINKEHFDIAKQKISIGNSITSIREINRINFLNLFEKINGVEELLRHDPANVYANMDYKSKEYYRNIIKKISERNKISEIYITNTLLKLANNADTKKKRHIGYYLIDKGINSLNEELGIKRETNINRSRIYISSFFIVVFFLTVLFGIYIYNKTNLAVSILVSIFGIIPISEIYIQTLNYVLSKITKPVMLPKLAFLDGIPEEYRTMVVIPTIVNSKEKVKELFNKMEVFYLANKDNNIYFTLLGDCTSSKNKEEECDSEIIEEGIHQAELLNEKYSKKFFFMYRERTWNESEQCYLGWERKRGMLSQFNEFLLEGKNKFKVNTIDQNLNIKYVITLDSDTNLSLGTAKELIGTMAHILNEPVIDNDKNIVIDGHAIIQPRIGVDLIASRKSLFSKIYAGDGGTDSYTNAISDVYQDNFGEGIFTGKGIYDLKVFDKILKNEFPENTVLSHDLLEGNYLRCGLVTDILLMDGFPFKYNSYEARAKRWVRGDWQIVGWLKDTIICKEGKKKNPLNQLSKFKILDNLRRSLVEITAAILFIITIILDILNIPNFPILLLVILAITSSTILDIINSIIFRKSVNSETINAHRSIIKSISGLKTSIIRGFLAIAIIPSRATDMFCSITKTIYRVKISKKNLLEWITSEEAEKQSKNTIGSYYKNMYANLISGIILIILGVIYAKIQFYIFGFLYIFAPIIEWYISQEEHEKKEIEELNKYDVDYCIDIGRKTWDFFEDNINEENNYLPPDNYQEDRKEKIAFRTSPTNIGLRITCSLFRL